MAEEMKLTRMQEEKTSGEAFHGICQSASDGVTKMKGHPWWLIWEATVVVGHPLETGSLGGGRNPQEAGRDVSSSKNRTPQGA